MLLGKDEIHVTRLNSDVTTTMNLVVVSSWVLNNTVILPILFYHVNSVVTRLLSQQSCNSLWYFYACNGWQTNWSKCKPRALPLLVPVKITWVVTSLSLVLFQATASMLLMFMKWTNKFYLTWLGNQTCNLHTCISKIMFYHLMHLMLYHLPHLIY